MGLVDFLEELWDIIVIIFWIAVGLIIFLFVVAIILCIVGIPFFKNRSRNKTIDELNDEAVNNAQVARGNKSAEARKYSRAAKDKKEAEDKAKRQQEIGTIEKLAVL